MVHPFLTLHIAHRIVPCSIVKCFILPFYILFVTTAYIFQQLCTITQSCPILLSVIECSLTNEKNVMIQLKIHEMRFDYMNNPYDENNQQMGYGQEPSQGPVIYPEPPAEHIYQGSPGFASASLSMGILSLVSMCWLFSS